MIAILSWLSCATVEPEEARPTAPQPIDDAECAVCGMIVAEQAAPRGQVAHRDGTHAHLCSLGDLRAYVQAPGPRGRPVSIWVEGLEASYDPAQFDVGIRPWVAAKDATYVVGLSRPRVMGSPALSYAQRAPAERAASSIGGRVVGWAELVQTPFSEDPRQPPITP